MRYPLLSRLILSRYREIGHHSISLSASQIAGIADFKKQCDEGAYAFEDVSCLCGSKRSYCIGLSDRYGMATETRLCLRCGVLRTSPRLTEASLHKFYTELYARIYEFSLKHENVSSEKRWEQRFEEQKLRGKRLLHEIESRLSFDRSPVVFDVGCNTGATLIPFRDAGATCFGCDIGTSGFEIGRRAGLTLIEGNEDVLRKFGPADFIILSHVLEHLPDPQKTLRNLRSLLRPGGYLYIELPGVFQFHKHPLGMMRFLQNAHLYHFTLGTLTNLLFSEGYTLIKGNQGIAAFFQNTSQGAKPLRCKFFKPYLLLLYIFFVEILYRTHLLPFFTAVSNTVHRGVRHLVWDFWTLLKNEQKWR